MALVEYYIGTTGPFYIDDADPLYNAPTQMAIKQDVADGIVAASDSVTDETTFGLTPSAGVSSEYSRSDHTHGTPENPVAGLTVNKIVGTETWHFVNGLLTSVT